MFAGGRRRSSNNIRAMQLFHELKQQFPTVPDNIVLAYINHANKTNQKINNYNHTLEDVLDIGSKAGQQEEELMGRNSTKEAIEPALTLSKSSNAETTSSSNISNNITNSNNIEEEELENTHKTATAKRRTISDEMDKSESDVNRNVIKSSAYSSKNSDNVDVCASSDVNVLKEGKNSFFVKRPDTLDIRKVVGDFNQSGQSRRQIQPSGRCSDIHKLLNSETLNNKPPRSPLSNSKKFANLKNSTSNRNEHNNNNNSNCKSPIISPETTIAKRQSISSNYNNVDNSSSSASKKTEQKRETADTPTQTTDTLLGPPSSNGLNLSLNVNCSMDLVQSPTRQKCSTSLQIVPQQPWCQDPSQSQRSYTSVNLTLRPPSTEPQAPIDITSQNSSLTYSTSSFDSQKGLASRLEITVGPSGTGSVSSLRVRPRSSYHPETTGQEVNPIRAGSLPDLAGNMNPSVIIKQEARIEKLKIELRTEKTRLIAMQQEIAVLENMENNVVAQKMETKLEQQLQKEIKHLRGQCERLTLEVDRQSESRVPLGETNEEFYRHIYTGQRLPNTLNFPTELRIPTQNPTGNEYRITRSQQQQYSDTVEGPKWNCHMCTFQNHPLLDKCEQCEMPRILHGRHNTTTNLDPSIAFRMIRPIGQDVPYSPNQMWNLSNTIIDDDTTDSNFLRAFEKIFNAKKANNTRRRSNINHSQSANEIHHPRTENVFNRNFSIPNHLMIPTNTPSTSNNRRQSSLNSSEEFAQDGPSTNKNNHFINNTKTCDANC